MSNLNIINDWINGNNLRPVSITFAQDKQLKTIRAKKEACKIGDTYEDVEGNIWKRLGANSWAKQPKILNALKDSNPSCKCCSKEIDYLHNYDVTAYAKSKCCFDCMIEIDTERKIAGTYNIFEDRHGLETQKAWVTEKLTELHEYLKSTDSPIEFINEFGDREIWGGNLKKLKADIQSDIDAGISMLEKIETELSKLPAIDAFEFDTMKERVLEKRKRVAEYEQSQH